MRFPANFVEMPSTSVILPRSQSPKITISSNLLYPREAVCTIWHAYSVINAALCEAQAVELPFCDNKPCEVLALSYSEQNRLTVLLKPLLRGFRLAFLLLSRELTVAVLCPDELAVHVVEWENYHVFTLNLSCYVIFSSDLLGYAPRLHKLDRSVL